VRELTQGLMQEDEKNMGLRR